MTHWRATAALRRATMVAGGGLGLALVFGDPVLVVLTAPFALLAVLALLHRPSGAPAAANRLDHLTLHEGQGTRSHLDLRDATAAEHVVRVAARAPYVALHPATGVRGALVGDASVTPDLEISPRRWGRRVLGEEKVALTTPWAGFRWGPVPLAGQQLTVLPTTAPYDSQAELPHAAGLVGSNRSRRLGDGQEPDGIRPFHAGDRLRRVHWRTWMRTGELHVVSTRAEQDASVLLLVDALADLGRSGGVDGDPSSMDLTVRAAASMAEHLLRRGDRVALRLVGGGGHAVPVGAGERHLRRVRGTLARIVVGRSGEQPDGVLGLGVTAGTVVVVLSSMLQETMATTAATLQRRGLPVLVVDTLPATSAPDLGEGVPPRLAGLAWRMRLLEREAILARLAGLGCPVVVWGGPGTLDEVLRRLARRAQLPQVALR